MQQIPAALAATFDRRLDGAGVPAAQRQRYHDCVRLYLSFCQQADFPPTVPTALGPFLTRLAAQNYSIEQRHHAAAAVRLLLRPDARDPELYIQLSDLGPFQPGSADSPARLTASWEREYRDLESDIKLRNYSPRTLEAYRFWITRFQAFVRSRPTAQLSNRQVRGFLSSLAVQHGASASSQNQAFNSLLFFFRHVLRRDFGQIDGVVRAGAKALTQLKGADEMPGNSRCQKKFPNSLFGFQVSVHISMTW